MSELRAATVSYSAPSITRICCEQLLAQSNKRKKINARKARNQAVVIDVSQVAGVRARSPKAFQLAREFIFPVLRSATLAPRHGRKTNGDVRTLYENVPPQLSTEKKSSSRRPPWEPGLVPQGAEVPYTCASPFPTSTSSELQAARFSREILRHATVRAVAHRAPTFRGSEPTAQSLQPLAAVAQSTPER